MNNQEPSEQELTRVISMLNLCFGKEPIRRADRDMIAYQLDSYGNTLRDKMRKRTEITVSKAVNDAARKAAHEMFTYMSTPGIVVHLHEVADRILDAIIQQQRTENETSI